MTDHALDDEAGDVPPTGGFEDERRHGPRRQEDTFSRDMQTWVAALFIHRGKLVVLVSIITWAGTTLGWKIVGPSQDIDALDKKFTQKDSLMNIRVTGLEDGQTRIRLQLGSIEEQLRFIAFLQCTSLRTTNPNLALDGCPTRRP